MTSLDAKIATLLPSLLLSVQESVRIPSIAGAPAPRAPFGTDVRRALDHALKTASLLGLETGETDGYVGWAEYGEGEEMIAVLGHLDVVPAGEGWSRPPFGAEIDGTRMYGRGALDDKGPSIGALWLLHAIKTLGIPLKRRIRVLFGTNEESGMKDLPYYLEHNGEVPVMGFTPDGEFPVVSSEKGQLHLKFEGTLAGEGKNRLLSLSGGSAPNVVPSEATAVIDCSDECETALKRIETALNTMSEKVEFYREDNALFVKTFGIAAHGSTPELGRNAVVGLLSFLSVVFDDPWARTLGALARSFEDDTKGRKIGIAMEDKQSGALTCNLGQCTCDGKTISIVLDIRFPVSFAANVILDPLRSFAERSNLELSVLRRKAPLWAPEDSALVKTLQRVYREKTGEEPHLLSMGGGTYAKALPNIVAFGPKFPHSPEVAHKADEYIDIREFLHVLRIMGAAMVELAS